MKLVPFLNMQSTVLIRHLEGIQENPVGREFVQSTTYYPASKNQL
jgi:hypothetical protein